MKKQNENLTDAALLRQKAEELLQRRDKACLVSTDATSEADMLKLIHELEVHQIELVMQNDELIIAKVKAELAEEKYTELYDFAPSGYIALSKEGEILELNFASANMLGKERTKLIKNRFGFFVSMSTQKIFNLFLQDVVTSKLKQTCEVIISTDGHLPIYVNIEGVISQNDEYCLLTLTDITERKLAEITLLKEKELVKESEEKFRAMYNNAPLSYQSLDENGCFIDINPMWLKTLGYEIDEVIGKWYGDFLHPDYVEHFRINFPAFKKRGYVSDVQFKLRRKDNTYIYVSFEGCVGYTPEGKFKQTYCVFKDITEQKAIEIALINAKQKAEESEARYRLIADNTSDSIWVMDADLRFTYLSPSTEKLFGYTLKEWETLDWNTFLKPDYVETIHKVFDGFKSGKQESVNLLSVIVRHKNGTEMWIEFSANPLFDENKVFKSAVGITRDITERKQAELQIKHQNEELQKLNATKDKFFSIIVHDLKSPFSSIMGFCELLVVQINEKRYNEIEKYAGIIRQSSQKAFNLLMNLMEWSRSQSGRMEFNPVQIDLIESILEITAMFDDIAGQKGIVIKRELPSKVAAFADQSMINTVLRNLISNAIKFTNPGGEIILTVIEEKNKLTVSVKDNGIGIPNNSIDKLFRIDENYSTRGTASETGTGLGLILCKEFVEKHNGEIWVESEQGKGSSFYFTLPYNAN